MHDEQKQVRFLIRDRDAKSAARFATGLAAEGIAIVRTPDRAPRAKAGAERGIRSVRAEVLNCLLILNEAHVRRVMQEYVEYYKRTRPDHGIE